MLTPPPCADAAAPAIEVWALALGSPASQRLPFESWLDAPERERAARFATPALRHDFVTARGALRLLLATRTGVRPEAVELRNGPRGKPALAAESPLHFNVSHSAESPLHFNVSHSGGVALYALSAELEVGIDVEAQRPLPDVDALVPRVMSAVQAAHWRALPAAERLPAFYRDWTRKEACVKASGDGLWAELGEIEFSGSGPLRARDAAGQCWTLLDLPMSTGHAAALAWRGDVAATVAPLRWFDPQTLPSPGA